MYVVVQSVGGRERGVRSCTVGRRGEREKCIYVVVQSVGGREREVYVVVQSVGGERDRCT